MVQRNEAVTQRRRAETAADEARKAAADSEYRRLANAASTAPTSPDAVAGSAIGALAAVDDAGRDERSAIRPLLTALSRCRPAPPPLRRPEPGSGKQRRAARRRCLARRHDARLHRQRRRHQRLGPHADGRARDHPGGGRGRSGRSARAVAGRFAPGGAGLPTDSHPQRRGPDRFRGQHLRPRRPARPRSVSPASSPWSRPRRWRSARTTRRC